MITIAVDCMGGDHGPSVPCQPAPPFWPPHPQARLLLVGLPDALSQLPPVLIRPASRSSRPARSSRWMIRSRWRCGAARLVDAGRDQPGQGRCRAAVSAGNTGALMAIARFVLKTLDGIDRPAIAGRMPNVTGGATIVLDLGANVDCSAEHLLQFAVMGSALAVAITGDSPTVGLLNIGEEAIKGNRGHQAGWCAVARGWRQRRPHFQGNVEGNDIFKGAVDIVVCDGSVGNVALKASEGLASMIGTLIKQSFSRNILTKMAAIVAYPVLAAFGGESTTGAATTARRCSACAAWCSKSHGSADAFAFEQALARARMMQPTTSCSTT